MPPPAPTLDEILTQWSKRTDAWQPLEMYRTTEAAAKTIDLLVAEVERLRNALDEHLRSEQQGHTDPCTYGPLCPYCEIERLREVESIIQWYESQSIYCFPVSVFAKLNKRWYMYAIHDSKCCDVHRPTVLAVLRAAKAETERVAAESKELNGG